LVSVNVVPQVLHLYRWRPAWVLPYLTISTDLSPSPPTPIHPTAPIEQDDHDKCEDMKQDCFADAHAFPDLNLSLLRQRLDAERHPCEPRLLDDLKDEQGAGENEERAAGPNLVDDFVYTDVFLLDADPAEAEAICLPAKLSAG